MTLVRFTISADGAPIYIRELDLGDDFLVRAGWWYWYRDADTQELRECVAPDLNMGAVGDGELEAVLRGERRHPDRTKNGSRDGNG